MEGSAVQRYHSTTATEIYYELSLVFDTKGGVRLVRGAPRMEPNERELRLHVALPKAIFRTPSLSAKINVGDIGTHASTVADIEKKAVKALRNALTGDFKLTIIPPPEAK